MAVTALAASLGALNLAALPWEHIPPAFDGVLPSGDAQRSMATITLPALAELVQSAAAELNVHLPLHVLHSTKLLRSDEGVPRQKAHVDGQFSCSLHPCEVSDTGRNQPAEYDKGERESNSARAD